MDAAGIPKGISYSDNYTNKPVSVGPTETNVTATQDAVGLVNGTQFDYYTGQPVSAYIIPPGSSVAEQLVTTSYDFADRPLQATRPDGGWVKTGYWDNLLSATAKRKNDQVGSTDQVSFSLKYSDGVGHIIRQGGDHPNAIAGKYSGQKFVFNNKGEQSDASNITAIDANWTPIDEDAATGWLFKNFQYDAQGKLKVITDTDGTTVQNDYLGCGCAGSASVTTTDQTGIKTTTTADFLGRLKESSEPGRNSVTNGPYNKAVYTYDTLDRVTTIDVFEGGFSPTKKQTRSFIYDGYGRLQSETSPEAGTETYTYTTNDLPAARTDARGKVVTITYNTRNLVTGVSYNDTTPGATYGYDEYGARSTMNDGEGAMTYHYNGYRQMDYETRTFTGLAGQSFTLNYTYNKADQLTKVNYATSAGWSKNINYAHNSVGALTGVGTSLIGTDPNATTNVLSGVTYNGFGAIKSQNYGNGRRMTTGYSVNRHQMISSVVDNQNGTDAIINKACNYWTINPNTLQPNSDNDGRIKKITDNVDSSYTTNYAYDEFNRLDYATATAYKRVYNYDSWGNITKVYTDATSGNWNQYTLPVNASGAPATNRMSDVKKYVNSALSTTTNYSWDNAGNTTAEGSTAYSYDAANRLKEVGTGGQNVYGYDGSGQRVRKVESGGAALYYVRSGLLKEVAIEVNQAQGVFRAYVRVGSQVVAEQSSDGSFNWLHSDHLGSSRKLTNTSGVVVYRGEFDPHGQLLLETGTTTLNSRKFTGYERDAATGLDYANARMYSSGRGRFVQPDPIGLKAADLKVPQSLNQYTYVFNDPVNHADPSGLLTIIIGGTGNGDADWGQPNTPFWDAVRDTFGEDPIVFPWDARIEGVLWPVYFDIYNGASDLIDFINTYPFKEGEKLNIVAHSHGGNLVKIASWYLNRRIDNLVTLGTPVNYDLLGQIGDKFYTLRPGEVANYCNVSSLTDNIQFAGAGVDQIINTGELLYLSARYFTQAWWDVFGGNYFAALKSLLNASEALASAFYWYLTTKLDPGANRNVLIFGAVSHSDLHTVSVWNAVKGVCGLPQQPQQSRGRPVGPTHQPRSRG